MLILHMKHILSKSSQHSSEFPIVFMIWYAWLKPSAMFKQQDVRWCDFRWSILISIGYVWNSCIDRAISTSWYSYCILNSHIKKPPLVIGLMRETISHAGLWWNASLDGDSRYMDGRRECEDIGDSREILNLYSPMYIYIIYLSYLLTFLLNNGHYTIV